MYDPSANKPVTRQSSRLPERPTFLASNVFDGVMPGSADTYKTSFWDSASQAYDPLYPARVLASFSEVDPAKNLDIGLPVPNVEDLYIGPDGVVDQGCGQAGANCHGFLSAVQHAMPGSADPYVANAPQPVKEHYEDKPFFINFPFGYVAAGVDWYEGAGIRLASFDDNGRENAYPLVRVQARNAQGSVVATVDKILPISGEASCGNCHTTAQDYASGNGDDSCLTNRALLQGKPVVCQVCHYTPALDLAQVDPMAGPDGNGRK
jgi:hypothetical protein